MDTYAAYNNIKEFVLSLANGISFLRQLSDIEWQ